MKPFWEAAPVTSLSKRKMTEEVMKGARFLDLCSEVDRSFHE